MDQEFKFEGQCQGHKISIFKNKEKQGFLADLNRYWKVLQKGTKKIINIIIENYVYSFDSETKMNQYFKSEGQCQGHKISIFKNKEKQGFLPDLNRYWKVLQKGTKKIINIIIENYVYSFDSETKMNQYFKSEGQCQGHKISIFEIVEKHGFSVNLNQFLIKYCRR